MNIHKELSGIFAKATPEEWVAHAEKSCTKSGMSREALIDKVLDQMREDLINHDLTAIEELLKFVPDANLIGYLPEEEQ
jgi:hypothetical protein